MKLWKITFANDEQWNCIQHYFIKARNKEKAILKFQRKTGIWYVKNIEEVK